MINFDMLRRNLFIGSCPKTPVDIDRIRSSLKVTAILNLQTDEDFDKWEVDFESVKEHCEELGVELVRFPIIDWNEDDLRIRLRESTEHLARLVADGHRTYVHCTAGIGRAPAAVIGYLVWHEDIDLDDAVAYVKKNRQCDPYVHVIREIDQEIDQIKN